MIFGSLGQAAMGSGRLAHSCKPNRTAAPHPNNKPMKVAVVLYRPEWKAVFARLKAELQHMLVLPVEHIVKTCSPYGAKILGKKFS